MNLTKIYSVALAMLVLFMIPTNSIIAISVDEVGLDPVIYEKLLDDVLTNIINEKYSVSEELIEIGSNIVINETSLKYIHGKLYDKLLRINELLNQSMYLEQIISSMNKVDARNYIRKIYNELFLLKNDLRDYVDHYLSVLARYVHDRSSFFIYQHDISIKTELLIGKIDDILKQLEKIYRRLEYNVSTNWIEVLVDYPDKIYGGETIWLNITLKPHYNGTNTSRLNASVTIMVSVGGIVEEIHNLYTLVPSTLRLRIKLPGAETLIRQGVEFSKKNLGVYYSDLIITIKVVVLDGEHLIRGYKVIDTDILFEKPRLYIKAPSIISMNQTLTLNIESQVELPLNASIYVDKVSNATLLYNTLIYPGDNVVIINNPGLSIGYHTIIVLSEPYGKYVSSRWSSALAVTSPSIGVSLSVPRVVIGLTQSFSIMGFVKDKYSYEVIISIDNVRVYDNVFSSKRFSIVIDPPFSFSSFLVWFRRVDIEISPLNTSISVAKYSYNVLFINPLFIMLLVVFTGLVYMHPLVSSMVSGIFHSIRSFSSRRKTHGEHEYLFTSFRKKKYVELKPKAFNTRKYYRSVLAFLSNIVGYPKESETLREYVSRIRSVLPKRAYGVVYQLFMLFEQDLYSAKKVSVETVRRLYKSLLKMVKK